MTIYEILNDWPWLLTLLGLAIVGTPLGWWFGRRRARARFASTLPGTRLPLREVFEQLPASVTVTDHARGDEPLVYANRRFHEETGLESGAVLGRNLRCLQGPDTDPAARREISEALRADRPISIQLRNYRANGEPFWNLLSLTPLRDAAGAIPHYLGLQFDVTDQVEQEFELARRHRQHFALAAIAQLALESISEEEILDRLVSVMRRAFEAEHVEIVQRDPDGERLLLRAGFGASDPAAPGALPEVPGGDRSMAGFTLGIRRTVVSPDLTRERRFAPRREKIEAGARSGVTTVIMDGDRYWGVLGVFSDRLDRYDTADADFVQSMAYLVGSAITRVGQTGRVTEHARFLDAVLDGTSDAIVVIDADGTIERVNQAFCPMFGRDADSIRGENVRVLMPSEHARHHDQHLARYLGGGPPGIIGLAREVTAVDAQGRTFPVLINVSETRVGARRLFVGTLRDLREQKEMQSQLLQAQKMESIGQLTGGIAHDFNNLLTVILGNVGLATEGSLDGRQRMLLEAGLEAARQGADLTRRLLTFARSQPLSPTAVDLGELFASLASMVPRLVGERYDVAFEVADDTPRVHADRAQLDAALLNLIVNARDAMPQGGRIRVLARAEPGPVAAEAEFIELRVSDNGPGIPPELRDRIFEPFFTTKEEGKGTGLGLAMIHGFVHQSGGSIDSEDGADGGACFRIRLPVDRGTVAAPADVATPSMAEDRPLQVLLVEDEPMVREIAERMLERLSHVVQAVESPDLALEILRGEAPVDLLFTDSVMPGEMSGRDLAREARALRPGLAVLVTSGYTEEVAAGADAELADAGFIQKPYGLRALADGIRDLMARRGDAAI